MLEPVDAVVIPIKEPDESTPLLPVSPPSIITWLLSKIRGHAPLQAYKNKLLPDELLLHILSFLSAKDLAVVAIVCRELNVLAEDAALWKNHALRDYAMFRPRIEKMQGRALKFRYRNQLLLDNKLINRRTELQTQLQRVEGHYRDKLNTGLYIALALMIAAGLFGAYWGYDKWQHNDSLGAKISPYLALICLAAVALTAIITLLRLLNEALSVYGKNKMIDADNAPVIRYNEKVMQEFGPTLSSDNRYVR
jgi:F-box associated protein